MKLEDIKERNIPQGSIIEIIYGNKNIDNELVYFESVGRNEPDKNGIDILYCKERSKSRVIGRNLEVIEDINVYRIHRKYTPLEKKNL
tara:strand:- start:1823 stop:2086 length:264 start_codon:yes stop_codon:yes gene_type:complete